jgi:FkbM family methyltransferase
LGRIVAFVQGLRELLDILLIVPSNLGRLKVTWLWCTYLLKQQGRYGRTIEARITWQGPNGPITGTVSDLSELKVIGEIFAGQEYAVPQGAEPRVIVDLGSHAGFSVLFFKALYPEARIIAVEANPITYRRLLQNISPFKGIEPLHAAVTSYEGEVTLYSGAESWAATLKKGQRLTESAVVPAITLGRLMEQFDLTSIDLLKVDIEGAECELVASSKAALRRTKSVIFEYHQEHDDGTLWTLLEGLETFRLTRLRGDSSVHPLVTLVAES